MADVTVAGVTVTVSGGDLWNKDGHIDDNFSYGPSTAWASSQSNTSSPSVLTAPAYIGIDLGAGNVATIDELLISQASLAGNSLTGTDKISFQYSSNGSDWTEHEKLSPTVASVVPGTETLTFAATSPAARFFRLVALANPTGPGGSVWGMAEVEYHGTLNPAAGGGGGGGMFAGGAGRRARGRRR